MGLSLQGLETRLGNTTVVTNIREDDPLIKLGNLIDWSFLVLIVRPDLQKTDAGFWRKGRKINLRIHLAVMILQVLLKASDRGMEAQVNRTPLFQAFCGLGLFSQWKCPDHTKVEEFRNRLAPETHKKVGDYVVKLAVKAGFASPRVVDIDSTVQEANMAYPSDAAPRTQQWKKGVGSSRTITL